MNLSIKADLDIYSLINHAYTSVICQWLYHVYRKLEQLGMSGDYGKLQ